ncbi:MAG: SemiSWEET transporter [Methylobacter sp.]|nr:SemiSWEET transporter [Methylobacter sp.]
MTITPEMIGYLAATLTTASFVPQAILTIKTRSTESLSLGMYSAFTLGVLCWLIYGIHLGDKAIIFSNAITLLLAASILFFKIYNLVHKKKT